MSERMRKSSSKYSSSWNIYVISAWECETQPGRGKIKCVRKVFPFLLKRVDKLTTVSCYVGVKLSILCLRHIVNGWAVIEQFLSLHLRIWRKGRRREGDDFCFLLALPNGSGVGDEYYMRLIDDWESFLRPVLLKLIPCSRAQKRCFTTEYLDIIFILNSTQKV